MSEVSSTSSTDEFQLGNNSIISQDNYSTCQVDSHVTELFPTVHQGSTTTGKASRRFWNWRLRDVYESCVLPTEIDSAGSATSSSNTYSSVTVQQSSLRITMKEPPKRILPMTFCQSLLCSALASMVEEAVKANEPPLQFQPSSEQLDLVRSADTLEMLPPDDLLPPMPPSLPKAAPFKRKTVINGQLRVLKIRLMPTASQTRELKRAFSAARHAYNWANERVRNGARPNFIELRNAYRAHHREHPLEWASGENAVSTHIVAGAIKQLADAYSSNFAKRKKDASHTFDVKFRSLRKTQTESLRIDKDQGGRKTSPFLRFERSDIHRGTRTRCYVRFGSNLGKHGSIMMEDKQRVINMLFANESEGKLLDEDCKILYDKRTRAFHFAYSYILHPCTSAFSDIPRIASNDPGIKVFQTVYCPDGSHGEVLPNFGTTLIERLCKLDRLQSRLDHEIQRRTRKRHKLLRTLRRKLGRERRRHHGFVASAHYFAANYLLKQFDYIVQPRLATRRLSEKAKRMISTDSTRRMLTMSHGLYLDRLKSASFRYGKHVIESVEPGTSKTCTNCGHWAHSLSLSDRVYTCILCKVRVNRDVAGARNNLFAAFGIAVRVGWDGESG